jgi:phospholipid-binding lipoprotein MlaA
LFIKPWWAILLVVIFLAPGKGYGFQEGDEPLHAGSPLIKSDQGGNTTLIRVAAAGIETSGGVDAPGYTLVLPNPGSQRRPMVAQAEGNEEFEEEEATGTIPDPFRPVNYTLFKVNDKLYVFIFRPIAIGYKAVVPDRVRVGVKNMIENILFPVRFVNCMLQGKVEGAFSEMGRFLLNTFCGGVGFIDVASEAGVFKRSDADMDQTLGIYGFGQGFYIFWPVLGPSSARGTVGLVGDYLLTPLTYIETTGTLIGVLVFWQINNLSLMVDEYDEFLRAAIDPYSAMKNAYYQSRKAKIKE